MSYGDIPDWLGSSILGAVITVMGYTGTQILQWLRGIRASHRTQLARLAELLALIRAGDSAFQIQSNHRDTLTRLICTRLTIKAGEIDGYDRLFSSAYASMPPAERDLHDIIRAITIHTLKPLNEAILNWLKEDNEYRIHQLDATPKGQFAAHLQQLEAHLLLWQAKYAIWIPERPDHALVYLDDERQHGIRFPQGGAVLIERLLRKRRWWQP